MGRYDWEQRQQRRKGHAAPSGKKLYVWAVGVLAAACFGIAIAAYTHDNTPQQSSAAAAPKHDTPIRAMSSADAAEPLAVVAPPSVAVKQSQKIAKCISYTRFTCVVDGDTFWFEGTKVRIEDIDAPEVSQPKCTGELSLGLKATDRLIELLNQGPFELVQVGEREHDRYGRALRRITRDGKSLGDTLINEGLAHSWLGHKEPWC